MQATQEMSANKKFLEGIARLIEAGDFNTALTKCDTLIGALHEEDPEIQNPDHLQGYILKATALLRSNHPQPCLQICNALLQKFPDHTKLLHLRYVSLLLSQHENTDQTEELNAAFQKITENDKSEWVALADFLRHKAKISYENNLAKLQEIAKTFANSRMALYLCAHQHRQNPIMAEHFGVPQVSKDIFNQSTHELVKKALRAAILKGDFGQVCAIAEYSRPKFLSGLRSKVNVDQFWQNTQIEKDKILALLCASEVKKEYLDEVVVYCKNSYLANDLEAQLFYCLALANKRPINRNIVNTFYHTMAKQFPDNIFVLSMQPLLQELMKEETIANIDFRPKLQENLTAELAKLEALPADADPATREAIERNIALIKQSLNGYENDTAQAKPADDKCVCF